MSDTHLPDGAPRRPPDSPTRHVADLVTPYALGALDPDERALVDRHRRACPACDRLLRDEGRFVSLLPFAVAATVSPPPDVKIALFARVAHSQRAAADAAPPLGATSHRQRVTAGAAPFPNAIAHRGAATAIALPPPRPTPTPTLPSAQPASAPAVADLAPGPAHPPPALRPPRGTFWVAALLVVPLLLALAGTGTWAMRLRANAEDSRERASRFGAMLEATSDGTDTELQLFAGPGASEAKAWIVADDERLLATLVLRHDDPPPNARFRLVATLDGTSRLLTEIGLDERGRGAVPFPLDRPLAAYSNFRLKTVSSTSDATDLVLRAAPLRPPATPDAAPRP